MKQFFKFMFASIIGFFISLFILFFIFILFSAVIISSVDKTGTVSIAENTVLELDLNYEVPERTSYEPVSTFSLVPKLKKTLGLNDLTKVIKNAKDDEKISGIYINLDNLIIGGINKVNAVRDLLIDFKSSEKFIIAHGNSISEKAYFLGSIADSIFLTPTGTIEFDGFAIELSFFKNTLEKLEIEPQIFQYGKFKSATEPFRLDKLSNENELQLKTYLNSIYGSFLNKISTSTNIDEDLLKDISDNLKIASAEDAKDFELIDDLLYEDQVDSVMNDLMNSSLNIKKVSVKDYFYSMDANSISTNNRIAVIYALGEITNGSGDEFSIGTKNIINAIKKAKDNKRIKAIVMRVNSPGGSPLTSDMIWRELKLARDSKPVIISMGDVAASGGYYIAAPGTKIVSEPYVLTGSIGVYGILPNTQKFFNNKLGVTFDGVETGENSNFGSITSPLNDAQKRYFQKQVDDIYYDFVNRVSEGRNMTFEEVDNIAQGRIWSGIDAEKIGLVDTLGGLDLAIQIAADESDIKDYRILEYPAQKEAFDRILDLLTSDVKGKIDLFDLGEPLNKVYKISEALKYSGIQARLPFEYKIR
jgi:protease-4